MLGRHTAPPALHMPCQPAQVRRGILGNAGGHSGAAGSTPRQDTGTSHTLIKVKLQTRQGLTDPTLHMGQVQWHCGTWQGTAQVAQLGYWARGWWQGPRGCTALTWLNRWDKTMSGSVLVRPESCGGSTGSYCTAMAASCPRKPPGLGGGVGALPTLAAAQSIQPLPLGSMFIRTSPSTRSGKMSCREQEGEAQRGGEMCSLSISPCPGSNGIPVARLPSHCGLGTAALRPPILQEPLQQQRLPGGISSCSSPCPGLTAGTGNSRPAHPSPRLTANLAST